jgi:hypothetical protein
LFISGYANASRYFYNMALRVSFFTLVTAAQEH